VAKRDPTTATALYSNPPARRLEIIRDCPCSVLK